MASLIDATSPADGIPANKSALRSNLAIAKSEITALQAQIGTLSPYVFNGQRNRLMNGKMLFDQRNAGVATSVAAGGLVYGPDRWYGSSIAGGGVFSIQAISTGGPTAFPTYVRMTTTTAKVLVAADSHAFVQAIEGYNWQDMLYGSANALSATASFWVRASIAGSYALALVNSAGANSYVASYTVSVANTWEYKTLTIVGSTAGTWSGINTTAIGIRFDLGTGSNFHTTVGAWTASSRAAFTGATSVISTNGATLDITGVQLEPGSVATPWDNRLMGLEYLLLGRYYQAGSSRWDGYATVGASYSSLVTLSPYMRTTPTLTLLDGGGGISFPATAPTSGTLGVSAFVCYKTATATAQGFFQTNWKADSELTV